MAYLISGYVLVALNRSVFVGDIVTTIASPGHAFLVEVHARSLRLSDTICQS